MQDKLRLEGLTLTVESVAKSAEFYGSVLGLEVDRSGVPLGASVCPDQSGRRDRRDHRAAVSRGSPQGRRPGHDRDAEAGGASAGNKACLVASRVVPPATP